MDARPDPTRVRAMFARIAPRYDRMNRIMTLGRDSAWRRATIEAAVPRADGWTLDLGCGTGDLLHLLVTGGARRAIGLDPVEEMVSHTRERLGGRAILLRGDALTLPFADATLDCIVSAFVLRNLDDLGGAIAEGYRALAPGGRFVALELTPHTMPIVGPVARTFTRLAIPWLGGIIAGDRAAYTYLAHSIDRFPDCRALAHMLYERGFRKIRYRRFMLGSVALHSAEKPMPATPTWRA